MPKPVFDFMLDEKTPGDVEVVAEPREPVTDPTLGIAVQAAAEGTPRHRLVTIGDSLTQGFQSGAIFNTDISFPAIIADELGWYQQFRHPIYPGYGGLPLNIELLVRELEREYGSRIDWWEVAPALFRVRHHMAKVEDWWERGPGAHPPNFRGINHNLGIYGWDLRDTLSRDADICRDDIRKPKNQLFMQLVENANERAAIRVLDSARDSDGKALTPLQAATTLGAEGTLESGDGNGIETLIVLLGANNALGAVTDLKVVWSEAGYDDLGVKKRFTVWRPEHFAAELEQVVAEVRNIRARHVIWGTVPQVTIAPIARGVASKVRPGSRYFPYYTRPWISDRKFDARNDSFITEQEARAVDSAIDQYNYSITEAVRSARREGRDWYLLDVAGLLDRLAFRRYIDDPLARPKWWQPYELPAELQALSPVPTSRFFTTDRSGRTDGGLFSLDGVHPTTIAYGVMAQEFINVMQRAGVTFRSRDGQTPRMGPVKVDFKRLITLDTLISDPPRSLSSDIHLVGWIDQKLDIVRRMLRHGA